MTDRLEPLIAELLSLPRDERERIAALLTAQPSRANASVEPRKLVRKDGRLIVEALPGEHPITDIEVRDHLDKMDW